MPAPQYRCGSRLSWAGVRPPGGLPMVTDTGGCRRTVYHRHRSDQRGDYRLRIGRPVVPPAADHAYRRCHHCIGHRIGRQRSRGAHTHRGRTGNRQCVTGCRWWPRSNRRSDEPRSSGRRHCGLSGCACCRSNRRPAAGRCPHDCGTAGEIAGTSVPFQPISGMLSVQSAGQLLSTVTGACRSQNSGRLAQLARASGLHPEGRWFESITAHHLIPRLGVCRIPQTRNTVFKMCPNIVPRD